jgi:hypothetical protein
MTSKLRRVSIVCWLSAILLVLAFFIHPKIITWLPMSSWMLIFLLLAVGCTVLEMIIRFQEGMRIANGSKRVTNNAERFDDRKSNSKESNH